jgi:hypothetical protein
LDFAVANDFEECEILLRAAAEVDATQEAAAAAATTPSREDGSGGEEDSVIGEKGGVTP